MRLVTFEVQTVVGPFQRVGTCLSDSRIADVNFVVAEHFGRTRRFDAPYREAEHVAPSEMIAFIGGRERSLDAVREALRVVAPELNDVGSRGERLVYDMSEIRLR